MNQYYGLTTGALGTGSDICMVLIGAICGRFGVPKKVSRTIKPMKKTTTTEAKISPSVKFFFFWSDVVMALIAT